MEDFINFLRLEVKRHKALSDALPIIEKLSVLEDSIKELENRKNALQIDLQARTDEFQTWQVQSTAEKAKAASELLKAKEEASKIIKDAETKAETIKIDAKRSAELAEAKSNEVLRAYEAKVGQAKAELLLIEDDKADAERKLKAFKNELAALKAKI